MTGDRSNTLIDSLGRDALTYSLATPRKTKQHNQVWEAVKAFASSAVIPGLSGAYTERNSRRVKTDDELEKSMEKLALNKAPLRRTKTEWERGVGLEPLLTTRNYTVEKPIQESTGSEKPRFGRLDSVASVVQYAAGTVSYATPSPTDTAIFGGLSILTAAGRGLNGAVQNYHITKYEEQLGRAKTRTRPGVINHLITMKTMLDSGIDS